MHHFQVLTLCPNTMVQLRACGLKGEQSSPCPLGFYGRARCGTRYSLSPLHLKSNGQATDIEILRLRRLRVLCGSTVALLLVSRRTRCLSLCGLTPTSRFDSLRPHYKLPQVQNIMPFSELDSCIQRSYSCSGCGAS